MVNVVKIFSISLISILCNQVAWASGETENLSSKEWKFTVMPYVWGASLKGNVATLPPLPAVTVDASFGDIIKNTNLGFMGAAELRKGKFGIISDIVWIDLSANSSGVLPSPFTRTLKLDAMTLMATIAGAYRVYEQERGWLDLIAGVRGWYSETTLNVGPGILLTGRKGSHTEGWVDGLGGLRARINLWRGLHVTAITLGGGGASNSIADLTGTIGYTFTEQFSVMAGYRYLKVDYKNKGFVWDIEQQGPILGGRYTF